jgi:hypothetical protein
MCTLMGHLGGQLLLAITVFSHASCTFTSHHPPSCSGINSPRLFTLTPTINAKNIDGGPLGGGVGDLRVPIINTKMSMMAPLVGGGRDLGAPTINAKHVDSAPPRRLCRRYGSTHHQCKKTSMVGPLRGGARDPGASTINTKNIDDGPPKRWCWRSGAPTINAKSVDGGPLGPRGGGGPVSIRYPKGVL